MFHRSINGDAMTIPLLFVAISTVFVIGVRQAFIYGVTGKSGETEVPIGVVCAAFAFMLLVRIPLAITLEGYSPDVQTFQAWALQAAQDLPGFYSSGIFADYPPGYLYVLFLIGKLKVLLLLENDSRAFLGLIKMPAIIADMATVFLVYRLANAHRGRRYALALSCMYGFNPAIIVNSAAWGQVDAVFTLFIAISVVCLAKEWLTCSAISFALALLIKPQALIFSPLFLCAAFDRLLFQSFTRNWKRVLVSTSAGIAVGIAAIIPFAIKEGPLWIFRHYGSTLASYPYATLNAFNLFALSGGNFMPETDTWMIFSYKSWGAFFIVVTTLFAGGVYWYGRKEVRFYCMALFLISAVFMLSSKMHERYLFPVLIFSLLAFLYSEGRTILILFSGYSVTHFINVAYVLAASMRGAYHIPRFDPLLVTVSIMNLLLLGLTVRNLMRLGRSADILIPAGLTALDNSDNPSNPG